MTPRCAVIFAIVVLAVVVMPLAAEAQHVGKRPRIGYLSLQSPAEPRSRAFQEGLRELGYIDGQNVTIEYRWARHDEGRLGFFAKELIQLKVDVIVALEPPGARVAQRSTKTIPIVIRSTDDPVEAGFVTSLARPGGNVTGLSSISVELEAKRLELLAELVPGISRIAVLRNPGGPIAASSSARIERAARALRLHLQSLEARRAEDLEQAFAAAARGHAEALLVIRDPLFMANLTRIAQLAVRHRLPATFDDRELPQAGGLMSYGANLSDLYRRAAVYVDKILKGANPGDLPVEQPTKFELVINMKTAKALGLKIPPLLLLRADQVIE
ncbi:MAG: ABC transporter substrate-binding protein [Candidatus Rokubacteria bacterium]|nr:ABC transporter substrate-binding protein [Candidatus Rokubacteria bacterium]